MNYHEQLEQKYKMVIEIPMLLAEAVRSIAKDVKPNEYVLKAIVNQLKIDILKYSTASTFANDFLKQYEEQCQAQNKKEMDKAEKH